MWQQFDRNNANKQNNSRNLKTEVIQKGGDLISNPSVLWVKTCPSAVPLKD